MLMKVLLSSSDKALGRCKTKNENNVKNLESFLLSVNNFKR